MKRTMLLIVALVCFGLQAVFAQTRTVTGTVVSADDGETLPGVSVIVKGTTVGTVTNFDGEFSLKVPGPSKTLIFSFVGMKTQEVAISGDNYQVKMESDAIGVDEVMVVAYGTAKKSSFTGSASTVQADKLAVSKTESIDKALAGKVAGVRVSSTTGDPGSGGEVQVRGIGSISGSTQPLYVVDGVPMTTGNFGARVSSNVLATINPADIESMTVLKDAAAASLYGSRAANGVVIITTKKGKSGKTKFSMSANMGWSEMATNSYEMMNGVEYANYHKAALEGYYLQNNKALIPGSVNYGSSDIQAQAKEWAESEYLHEDWSYVSEVQNGDDYRDLIYGTGKDQEYQFSASGGKEKTNFFASVGYRKVEGIVMDREFERFSSTLNLNNKATDWLDLNFKSQLTYTNQLGRGDQSDQEQGISTGSPLSLLFSSNPTMRAYNEDGSYNMNSSFNSAVQNPLYALSKDQAYVENKTYRALNNFVGKAQLFENLSFQTTNSVDFIHALGFNFWAPGSVDGASLGGLGEKTVNDVVTLTTSNVLNYSKTFNEAHNFNAIAGFEIQKYDNEYVFASGSEYASDKLIELGTSKPRNASSTKYGRYMQSYFGNVSYDYKGKYYVAASLRSDESSRLGVENRQGTFYSVSGSWRFSEEDFFSADWITNGKLRASYGTNGQLPGDSYPHQGLYYYGGSYGKNSAIYLDQLENKDLGWEKSKNFNVGLDLTFAKRFSFTAEYYNKYTSDLLLKVPTSYLTGVEESLQNFGEISNSGVELELHANNILNREFKWDVDVSFATLKAKVEKLPKGTDMIMGDGDLYIYSEGEDLYSFYLPTYVGVDKESGLGQFLIDPSKGATADNMTYYWSQAGRTNQGSSYPTISGAFSNTFSWKGINLGVLMTYQAGGQLFDYGGYFSHHDGLRNFSFNLAKDVAGNYWTKSGDVVDNPRPVISNSTRSDRWSTRHLHSTDFIRLKELSLSYDIPSSLYHSIGAERISVGFVANNLAYLYAATKDMELEVPLNGYRTVDTPMARTYSFNVKVNF